MPRKRHFLPVFAVQFIASIEKRKGDPRKNNDDRVDQDVRKEREENCRENEPATHQFLFFPQRRAAFF